jgi:hypothetical protein
MRVMNMTTDTYLNIGFVGLGLFSAAAIALAVWIW